MKAFLIICSIIQIPPKGVRYLSGIFVAPTMNREIKPIFLNLLDKG